MVDLTELPPAVLDAWRSGSACVQAGHLAPALDLVIAAIDDLLGELVYSVLHNREFQRLEAGWRGLAYMVAKVPFHENIEVSMWSLSKTDLEQDFAESTELVRSRTFLQAYSNEIGKFGGRPFAAILGDMAFDTSPRDVSLLRQMAAIGSMAHAPFFAAASPALLQLPTLVDLPRLENAHVLFSGAAALEWNQFRETAESRSGGLLVGRPLHRAPHAQARRFQYTEQSSSTNDYLWGSPVYLFAVRLAESFAKHRTLSAIAGDIDPCEAPATVSFESLGSRYFRPPVDVTITPRLERVLRDVGLMPLVHRTDAPAIYLRSANSLQAPKAFGGTAGGREATLSYLLGTKFPYFLFACRIAHYLKLIERELIGETRTPETIEKRLNDWLNRFVIRSNAASAEIRAQYPLRRAQARVTEAPDLRDWFKAEIALRPHVLYLGTALNLVVSDRMRR
jgi:type VI secretion system protein ImpC